MDNIGIALPSLLKGISPEEQEKLLKCVGAKIRKYKKGEPILRAGDPVNSVSILISGSAQIYADDYYGNRTVIAALRRNELFAEAYAASGTLEIPVNVIATEDSEILEIPYQKLVTPCVNVCEMHYVIMRNLISILAEKTLFLSRRMRLLSKHTIREKLWEYLLSESRAQKSDTVRIPFSREELADYLAADRSALSRELGKMRDERLLEYHKNVFRLSPKTTRTHLSQD